MSALYLDLHLETDSEVRLRTKLYDKRDGFNFPIVNFAFICSNIPPAPAYEVYIYQLIRYSRECVSYQDFFDTGLLLTRKLLNKGTSKAVRSPPWLGWPLWNICVTNDHGNVPLVETFPIPFRNFVTRLTQWVPLVEHELHTLPEHLWF